MEILSNDAEKCIKQKLVLGFHILDNQGQGSDIAGHISTRAPKSDYFWTNHFPSGFDEAEINKLESVSIKTNQFDIYGTVSPALGLHCEIYKYYENINAIIHTHPVYAAALGIIGLNLEPIDQQAAPFFESIKLFDEHHGVFNNGEGGTKEIVSAIKNNKAILLKNHGILVFGEYIEEAIVGAITLEKAAKIQIISMAAGKLEKIPDESIKQAKKFLDQEEIFKWKFNYFARRAIRANQNIKKML